MAITGREKITQNRPRKLWARTQMKNPSSNAASQKILSGLLSALFGFCTLSAAHAQIFVVNGGGIGEYTTSGATINASLITDTQHPTSIAISGNDLFVANIANNTIGEYTASGPR